jgi:hypothetical protein
MAKRYAEFAGEFMGLPSSAGRWAVAGFCVCSLLSPTRRMTVTKP